MIKFGREGKATYSFSPTVTDLDGGTVTIKVLSDGEADSSGGFAWGLKEARTLVVEKGSDKYLAAYYVGSDSSFKIEVIGVRAGSWSVDGPLAALNYAGASDNCCLSCMGRLVCGYAVSTACGGCSDERWGELF